VPSALERSARRNRKGETDADAKSPNVDPYLERQARREAVPPLKRQVRESVPFLERQATRAADKAEKAAGAKLAAERKGDGKKS